MEKENGFFIEAYKGKNLFIRAWNKVKEPKGLVQIFHGMAEHSGRYDDFAKFLNRNGYIVYADDHRGHGYSLGDNNILAYVGEDGFNSIVEDEKIISNMIKEKHRGLPLYIFSHSFGSFIGQEYIIRYSEDIDGIILSGSAKQAGLDIKAAYILASLQSKLIDDIKPARLLNSLSFGSYNAKFKENQTSNFDWLSRDREEVNKYIEDDLSAYISPINFYYNLFYGLKRLYKPARLKNISKNLPLLVVSGDMDPVGKYGKSVKRLYQQYEDLNMKDISLKLFQDGRHELLNEINKEEVYDYIYEWLKAR